MSKPLSVRAQLSITFTILTVALIVVATLSMQSLAHSNKRFDQFVEGINARATIASQLGSAVDRRPSCDRSAQSRTCFERRG
jgi:methyl-accepting chemotaxis protein-1 (serine sensor receptor)